MQKPARFISALNNSSSVVDETKIIPALKIFSQIRITRRTRSGAAAASFLLLFCLLHIIAVEVRGDIYDCKSRVRNEWVTFCANDGSRRGKRGAIKPPRGSDEDPAEKYSNPRFRPPVSGDDLSSDLPLLSPTDIDELVTDLYDRYSRDTQTKEQFLKMINSLAAKCCRDNTRNSCMIDASNVITCP